MIKPSVLSDTLKRLPVDFNTDSIRIDLQKPINSIKPILAIPYTLWEIAGLVLIILVVLSLTGLLIFKTVKSSRKNQLSNLATYSLAGAMRELDELTKDFKNNKVEANWFYAETSRIIRTSIKMQLQINAPYLTSQQLLLALSQGKPLINQDSVMKLFNEADLVKFANFKPEKATALRFSSLATEIMTEINKLPVNS